MSLERCKLKSEYISHLLAKIKNSKNKRSCLGSELPIFLGPVRILRKCKWVQSLWKTVYALSSKLDNIVTFDPAIPFLGIYIYVYIHSRKMCIFIY